MIENKVNITYTKGAATNDCNQDSVATQPESHSREAEEDETSHEQNPEIENNQAASDEVKALPTVSPEDIGISYNDLLWDNSPEHTRSPTQGRLTMGSAGQVVGGRRGT